jgi:hypothetical protein
MYIEMSITVHVRTYVTSGNEPFWNFDWVFIEESVTNQYIDTLYFLSYGVMSYFYMPTICWRPMVMCWHS